jgi:hypothetical protein
LAIGENVAGSKEFKDDIHGHHQRNQGDGRESRRVDKEMASIESKARLKLMPESMDPGGDGSESRRVERVTGNTAALSRLKVVNPSGIRKNT